MIVVSFYSQFIFATLASIIMGGAVGLEREFKQKPAGLKTHILICVGAAVFTFLSSKFGDAGDPSRIAAQVVSGIGFIGAGTIMQSKKMIQGLTTAATLWVVAAIGMVNGAGYNMLGLILTLFVMAVLLISDRFYSTKRTLLHYSLSIEIFKLCDLEIIESMIESFELKVQHKAIVRKDAIFIQLNYRSTPITQHLFLKRIFELPNVGEIVKI